MIGNSNVSLLGIWQELNRPGTTNISLDTLTDAAVNTSAEVFSGSFHNLSMNVGSFGDGIATPFVSGQGSKMDWRNYNHDESFYQAVTVTADTALSGADVDIEMWLYDVNFNISNIFTGTVTSGDTVDFAANGGPGMYTHGDYYIGFTISVGPNGSRRPIIIDILSAEDVWPTIGAAMTLQEQNGIAGWNLNPGAGGSPFSDYAFADPNNVVNPDFIPWNRAPKIELRILDI
jgi:hypothetical protein